MFRHESKPAGHAARSGGRMGGDYQRPGSRRAHGADQGESGRDVVCVERTNHQRDARVLSYSGAHAGDRVRAPTAWGRPDHAHPYHLSGSHQRLRKEVSSAFMMKRIGVSALLALSLTVSATAHRLDEYLQATLIGVTRNGID